MLYWLFDQIGDAWTVLNVFRYITVRSAAAASTAFLLSLILGPGFIRWLKSLSFQQHVREEGPKSHHAKSGTPTMGGILILISVVVPTLLWADLANSFVWIALLAAVGFGGIGFIDDYAKITKRQNLGLSARAKMLGLLGISAILGLWMYWQAKQGSFTTQLYFPFFKNFHPELGIWFVPFSIFVLLATTNAVNLTDGLDGLAIGSSGIAFATYTAIAYVSSHANIAAYLDIPHILPAADLAVFGAATCGACIGFLWFNAHPAEVFMGDTGALALGGTLGCMALMTGHPLLLAIVGGLFVLETLSVILQVTSYRWRKKRIFLMAPIHHHFELKGWHESKVIIRFWIISLLLALLAVSTFKLR
ncbi:MAG: phospho-N-acetylmuramoyl-pentapeptide-transferase [Acidobacteria bacterium]|nr:phospho-N-acetylmuramoyl-pentapeptide-transferase [Acidobacteriota bacterium]MCB9396570.1 phospho-N-acetylmuramoyl-pentapeptide-transferase [Acidobacteriota bacterium]